MILVCWFINPDIEQTGNVLSKSKRHQNNTDLNQNACKVKTDLTVTIVLYELNDFLGENIHTH
jgi:hypothetical protein